MTFTIVHKTSENCFLKYIFKYTMYWNVFIIIGKFQSFYWQKNILYSFHLLKQKKVEITCIIDSLNLYIFIWHLFDIPAIHPLPLNWCNFCFLHIRDQRYLDMGMTSVDFVYVEIHWIIPDTKHWLMGEGNSSLFL